MTVCAICGSSDIHIMAWVGANDNQWKGDIDDEQDKWCESCQDHVPVKIILCKDDSDEK